MIRLDYHDRRAVLLIENLDKLTREGMEYALWISARQLMKATSADILKRPKGGRTYFRKDAAGRRRRHVASAPRETHANMTGTLRRSLSFRVDKNELEFGYGVQGTTAPEYAGWVEFGTNLMVERPSLRNNIRGGRRNMMNNLEREIRGKLR